jgi:hypothetical protein
LSNFHNPGMIECVDRHDSLLFFGCTKNRSTFIVPINPFLLKVLAFNTPVKGWPGAFGSRLSVG